MGPADDELGARRCYQPVCRRRGPELGVGERIVAEREADKYGQVWGYAGGKHVAVTSWQRGGFEY